MLYLIPTPIGNLEDITYRAVRLLSQCDAIYAEDTRHTLGLLNHLGIKKPLYSCHEHNERIKSAEIVRLAMEKEIALVSDAGMPGISDPGHQVMLAAIAGGIPVTVLPGPSAAVTALVLSGLPCDQFVFEGFLPRDKKERRQRIEALKVRTLTSILYESPFRLPSTLLELSAALGDDRPAAVCRELSKLYEECARGTLSSLAAQYQQPPKGEIALIVGGGILSLPAADWEAAMTTLADHIKAGEKPKNAAKLAASQMGLSANELYQRYISRKNEDA